jgi:hypothetical protein
VDVPTVVGFLSMLHEKAQFRFETCIHNISITDLIKGLTLKNGWFLIFFGPSISAPNLVFGFLSRSASMIFTAFFDKDDRI